MGAARGSGAGAGGAAERASSGGGAAQRAAHGDAWDLVKRR